MNETFNNKVVYISHPLFSEFAFEEENNVKTAMDVALSLIEAGITPYCPHLNYYLSRHAISKGEFVPYDSWMKQCLVTLERCDAMLYLGYSKGCNTELRYAIDNGIPVYFSLSEFLNATKKPCTTIS